MNHQNTPVFPYEFPIFSYLPWSARGRCEGDWKVRSWMTWYGDPRDSLWRFLNGQLLQPSFENEPRRGDHDRRRTFTTHVTPLLTLVPCREATQGDGRHGWGGDTMNAGGTTSTSRLLVKVLSTVPAPPVLSPHSLLASFISLRDTWVAIIGRDGKEWATRLSSFRSSLTW